MSPRNRKSDPRQINLFADNGADRNSTASAGTKKTSSKKSARKRSTSKQAPASTKRAGKKAASKKTAKKGTNSATKKDAGEMPQEKGEQLPEKLGIGSLSEWIETIRSKDVSKSS